MEKYEFVKELDAGSYIVMKNKQTEEVVAMKFIELGVKVHENMKIEIMNHQVLRRLNIFHLKEVLCTKTHAALVMKYDGEKGISKDEIVDGVEKYEFVKDLGCGSFGVTKLMRNKNTKELFAVKFIDRGPTIDENVEREIINHLSLQHPNIVCFKEVILTPTHLGIVMEYAAGGELFQRVYNYRRCTEDEVREGFIGHSIRKHSFGRKVSKARYFFQQLICGLEYIHSMQICHRDLKLDNILLDGSIAPRVKICDFGYSKSSTLYSKPNTIVDSTTYAAPMDLTNGQCDRKLYSLHSTPNTTVGCPTYAAPEVLEGGCYDGKIADVWSCGVTLYIMLVGSYPFEDPNDHEDVQKTIGRIMHLDYKIPDTIEISEDCRDLLSRIFIVDPKKRISLQEIKSHPWFLKKLAWELSKEIQALFNTRDIPTFSHPSVEEIMKVVGEAKKQLPSSSTTILGYKSETEKEEETDTEENEEAKSE